MNLTTYDEQQKVYQPRLQLITWFFYLYIYIFFTKQSLSTDSWYNHYICGWGNFAALFWKTESMDL